MFCPFCTFDVADDTTQCPECGSDLSGVLSLVQTSKPEIHDSESPINVSLSDTAIAGDVNIVQQLKADTDDIVERLVDQLDCFDINKPGLSVPDEGFSRIDIEAAIPLVREDANILKGMSSPHLVQFGKLLDSMGWPEVAKKVGKYLFTRDDVKSEPLWLARTHLILARSSAETFDPAACIIHADKAAEIARSAGLNDIESYALYLSIDKRKDLSRDSSKQGERVSKLLESASPNPGVAGSWCHLALSRYLDSINPDTAEHHEAMGFQHASNNRDIEAMVATLLATAENRIWTIKDSFWHSVKEESEINGLSSYSMLVDMADFVRSGSEHQLLSGIRTLTRHAQGRGMTEMNILASLVSTITDLHDLTSATKHGSQDRQSGLTRILSGEKVSHGLDEILTRSYQGFDHSLFYQFALMDMTGTQLPRIARGYLGMERAFPNDSVKAMVLLHKGLTNAGNPAQEVIDNVAEFLRDSKLGGDDIAWKLISEIATYHSARVGEVPAERGNQDNFATPDRIQVISNKRPLTALTFWFLALMFFTGNSQDWSWIEYNVLMRTGDPSITGDANLERDIRLLFNGIILISFIFSLVYFTVGTKQRKIIDLRHDKKLSFNSIFIFIILSHVMIIVNADLHMEIVDNFLKSLLSLSVWILLFYISSNSKWAHKPKALSSYYPRFIFTFFLFMYLLNLKGMLTYSDESLAKFWGGAWVVSDDVIGETQATLAYTFNLMILTAVIFPLLLSGLTKENLMVTLCSILASFTIYLGLFSTFARQGNLDDFIGHQFTWIQLIVAWLSIPLSYYVWMYPWPEEKIKKGVF